VKVVTITRLLIQVIYFIKSNLRCKCFFPSSETICLYPPYLCVEHHCYFELTQLNVLLIPPPCETVVLAAVVAALLTVVMATLLATVTHPPRNSLYQPLKDTKIKATLVGPLQLELVQLVHLVHGLQIHATS